MARRKAIWSWPIDRVAHQVVAAYARPDGLLASAVLDVPDKLIPRREVREREVVLAGQRGGQLRYFLHCFGFDEEDRVAIYMDGVYVDLVRDSDGFADLGDALDAARDWTQPDPIELDFEHLPGIYKWALFETVRGGSVPTSDAVDVWVRPDGGVEWFPPRLEHEQRRGEEPR